MADKKISRREAREQAFIIIFEKQFQADEEISSLVDFAKENNIFKGNDYSVQLADKVYENPEKIDVLITNNLKGWNFSRISKTAKAILRMSICEILFFDVPAGVAINEAVEIAKIYCSDEDPKFINGILGSVAKNLQA